MKKRRNSAAFLIRCIPAFLVISLTGCGIHLDQPTQTITPQSDPTCVQICFLTPVSTVSVNATPTSSTSTTPLPSPTPEIDCMQPSDNFDRITINGFVLNTRTYEMLKYAAELYQGPIDITSSAITQGSYSNAVDASFGTHAGGGAVDLSVMAPGTYDILYDEIEPLVTALRVAGFAAWFRDFNELYEGSPVHIHAIAIGDMELSPAAQEQLIGNDGYFLGYNGLPNNDGEPVPDPHGGPIICPWMIALGYPEMTPASSPAD